MKRITLVAVLLFSCLTRRAFTEPVKLLSTSPQFWATNVDAGAQKTISLTFDQKLRSTLTDWVGLDVLSPPSDLQTKYSADHKSCSIEVHLAPGRTYICALNGRGIPGVGFQTEKGLALAPTFLVFQTAGAVPPNDAPPHVVRSVPQQGTTVDRAKVQSLTISFDKLMNVKRHGLHMSENNNPIDLSGARFTYSADGMTFTLPYAFKPSSRYRFQLNDIHDIGFSGTNQVPVWPVEIAFATAQ